jgi:cytochrome b
MNKENASVVVWDVPVRVIHWLIVIAVGVSWWSAEERVMDVHRYSGYALAGLIIFRIYWGFAGSSTARFAQFVKGPRAIAAYLREKPAVAAPGHNPVGALSVMALLVLLLIQVTLGLFVTDTDGLESGPLSYLVSFDTSRTLADAHEMVFNLLLGFIVLHVAAVLFYLFVRRTNLIGAMFTGRRPATVVTSAARPAAWWRIVPGITLAGLTVWYLASE